MAEESRGVLVPVSCVGCGRGGAGGSNGSLDIGDGGLVLHTEGHPGREVMTPEGPPGPCAGCGCPIQERFYLRVLCKPWHVHCLTCSDCHRPLHAQLTCYARDEVIYCKEDYFRRFAPHRCSRCHLGVSSSDLVMRVRHHVFHLTCFSCSACYRVLTPGEEFGLVLDTYLYCRADYELVCNRNTNCDPRGQFDLGCSSNRDGSAVSFWNGAELAPSPKGRSRKRKSATLIAGRNGCTGLGSVGTDTPDFPEDLNLAREGPYPGHPAIPRQKRVRTSFKHQQLRTMKSYFSLNHNPDAKDLKQLAAKTGLSKRVLQVWFQNARAKYRRNILKQQNDSSGVVTSQPKVRRKAEGSTSSVTNTPDTLSPPLSDVSSVTSLCELYGRGAECGVGGQGCDTARDIFSALVPVH